MRSQGWNSSSNTYGALRRRRRRYAVAARRRRLLRRFLLPRSAVLPGGVRVERRFELSWRVRIPLLAISGTLGKRAFGWIGAALGMVGALIVELMFSYRKSDPGRPGGVRPGSPPGDGGGPAGVREPRRPRPTRDLDAAPLPTAPAGQQ